MALNIPTEHLQDSVMELLTKELGDTWTNLPPQEQELIIRVAINYGRENVKLLISELFQGIDKEEVKTNIQQIKAQLLALGVVLQGQVIEALNKVIMATLTTLLVQYALDRSVKINDVIGEE